VLSGVVLECVEPAHEGGQLKLLYVQPEGALMGKLCPRGTVIGHAQSLQHLYPGITNHVHVELWIGGVRVDPTAYFIDPGEPAPGGVVTA
jgi:hypothetical protein